ncbi:MAG: cell division protein ZapA [Gammaproteobacteria bacterium]|nr:cell division protein ZapA [Gammaproteobacteria bacterium]
MSIDVTDTTVEVLGKIYQFKCPEHEVSALQEAARALHQKMSELRAVNHILSADRLAVLAALNMSHQLLVLTQKNEVETQKINQRLRDLQHTLDKALLAETGLEFGSAE